MKFLLSEVGKTLLYPDDVILCAISNFQTAEDNKFRQLAGKFENTLVEIFFCRSLEDINNMKTKKEWGQLRSTTIEGTICKNPT